MIPSAPTATGIPRETSFRPYSPSSTAEHSSTLPLSFATASMMLSMFTADVQPEVLPLLRAFISEKKLAVMLSIFPISSPVSPRGSPPQVILS